MHRLEKLLGGTLRAQLAGNRVRTPQVGQDILLAFYRLSEARSWHANGPNPISYSEIEAFCRVLRVPFNPRHVAMIRALDVIWTEDFYQKRDRGQRSGGKTLPAVSSQPLSAAMMAVMFG